jgi:hypothetical protein
VGIADNIGHFSNQNGWNMNAIGITEVRHADFDISGTCHFAAVFTGQGDTEGALLGNIILQVLESHGVKTAAGLKILQGSSIPLGLA